MCPECATESRRVFLLRPPAAARRRPPSLAMAPNNKPPPVCVPDIGPHPRPQEEVEKAEKEEKVGVSPTTGVLLCIANMLYWNLMLSSEVPPDPRQDSWILMKSQTPTLIMSLAYILVSTWLGPKLMENRKPFEGLRPFMVAYNAFQVVFCTWLVFELGMGGWFGFYSFRCQACDFSDDPRATRMLHATYWYYFSKLIDFLDTIFFVLRKKYSMISLLHVSHHALMPACAWNGVRFQPGGHITLLCILNSFIHVVMYGYYLLAAMGPRVRPYLWWKKYLTTMQMIQFVIIFVHSFQMLFIDCPGVPKAASQLVMGHSLLLLLLFGNFYINAYRGKRNREVKDKPYGMCSEGNTLIPKAANGNATKLSADVLVTSEVEGLRPRIVPTRM